MGRRRALVVFATVVALTMSGCGSLSSLSPAAEPRVEKEDPHSHSMPDGTEMVGAEHPAAVGPSPAALMICGGQVVDAVASALALDREPQPASSWDAPMFTCTYELDEQPLVLSVHDVNELAEGELHFAEVKRSYGDAEALDGLLGLGMPSFSTPAGVVAFLRDGKTLVVDATALPTGLGPGGSRTQQQVAYAVASAVLICWIEHD